LNIVLITAVALILVFALMGLADSRMTNFIASALRKAFGKNADIAFALYRNVFRRYIDFFVCATVAAFIILLSRFLLSQFSTYFGEISDGLDMLVEGKGDDIKLSIEMAAMEGKLKAIKQTLGERERDARSAEQRKNDLVMYLAHDIKTPLTSVIGYLSLLDETPDMPPEQKAKYIGVTLDKAIRLERLVDEFFEITRLDFQADELVKESIDLYYMLAQMTDEFYPLLAADGKRAAIRVPEDMAICGDPDKLARVFNNILKNAVAYSPEKSVIDITAEISGDTASIVFTNEGGIPKEKLDSVFEKFYRLDAARSSGTGGAGLGMSIAKEIVAMHGGRIYADSDGKHTSFTVELPASLNAALPASLNATHPATHPTTHPSERPAAPGRP
jgi:two-component system sensor histidine kinase VanS